MTATKKTGGKAARVVERAKASNGLLARLKPYNKKTNPLRRYSAFGIVFEEAKGWYRVDPHVGAYLKNIRARPDRRDDLHRAFDVCTPQEAEGVAEREQNVAIKEGRALPRTAIVANARDVRSTSKSGPKPADTPLNAPAPEDVTPDGKIKKGTKADVDLTTADLRRREPPERETPQRAMRAARPGEV